ncbi:MAG: hypothetical protein ACTSQI_08325 [Candidatus Helarchaeota archaeon]
MPNGKTTTALSLLYDLFQEYFHFNVELFNATDSKDFLIKHKRKWYDLAEAEYKRQNSGSPPLNYIIKSVFRNFPQMRTFSEIPYRALIIQDADALTMDIQQALRRTLERSTRTCRFCLICENLSKIIDPIRSRCIIFHFAPFNDTDTAAVLRFIISKEQLDISDDALLTIIYLGKGNLRRAINLLQTVASVYPQRQIDADMVYQIINQFIELNLQQMLAFGLDQNFKAARTKLRELFIKYGMSGPQIAEQICRILLKLAVPMEWKINIADLLGFYELQMQKGSNAEIHLSAFIARLGTLNLE